jgi:DNA-binding GntR family transcriptional regulator
LKPKMTMNFINDTSTFGSAMISAQIPSQRNHVAQMLREMIISGELKSGMQLKQDEVSRNFHCSPGPVREALRDLESEGLVIHLQNRGVFVTEISNREFLEMLLPVRLILEKFALRDAAAKFTPTVVGALKTQIEIMREGAKSKDKQVVNEADIKFHYITMEAAASDQTLQLWKSVLSRVRLQFYRIGPTPNISKQAAHHQALLEILLTNDGEAIDAALEIHIIGTVSTRLKS